MYSLQTILQLFKQKAIQPYYRKRFTIAAILIIALISLGYWLHNQRYINTDDAYVNANQVQVAARITGQVIALHVKNNQQVHKDQLLIELDPVPFQVAVEKAKAQVIDSEAKLQKAQLTANRTFFLVKKKVMSPQDGDEARANLQSAQANLQLAKANLVQAELDLQYTHIYAYDDGNVSQVTLRVGDTVTANQSLFVLISNSEFWVDANYKETQLKHVRVGQSATIEVDMYPGKQFRGVVESISGGSGNAFSLLPPENATGNWVKITQRVPVRVRFLQPEAQYPLRIGTTATVTIDSHNYEHVK